MDGIEFLNGAPLILRGLCPCQSPRLTFNEPLWVASPAHSHCSSGNNPNLSIVGRVCLQRVWSEWHSAPAQDTLCSRFTGSTYDERGPTHAAYAWPSFPTLLDRGQSFNTFKDRPRPSRPCRSIAAHCRSGQDHHQDSRLFPIGPDLQIDLNRERIVAQWNGSINHAGMSSSSDLNSKYSEDYSIYLIYSDWMK